MHLKLFDIDEYCEKLPEITNPKIFESGKFSREGLFSQQIFGPTRSYSCACNGINYKGRNTKLKKCSKCGVDITTTETRRKRFAKISLPFPVLNPIYYHILISGKPSLKDVINNILQYLDSYFINEKGLLTKVTEENKPEDEETIFSGLNGIQKLTNYLIEQNPTKKELQFLKNKKLEMSNLVVIPPDFRPCGKDKTGKKISDEINSLYSKILIPSNHMRNLLIDVSEKDEIFRNNFKHIQLTVNNIYEFILKKLSKKKGLIRSNILGKRVDFSGRAVISPEPNLKLDTCRVPYWMILELLKPQLTAYLINRRICKKYNKAVKIIEDCLKHRNEELFQLVKDFCSDKLCILNRQPTLHRLSVLAFKVDIHLGNTIQIHPMICSPYNADFDGDQMACYFPITKESYDDIYNKIAIWNNLISPTDITMVPEPNQDIILGIYKITE